MFKRFLLSTFRNFKKNKSYTLINILGLAIGITCSLLIFIVIQFELSFDTFHSNKDRIYRINIDSERPSGMSYMPATPYPIAKALTTEFPEVEKVALVRYDNQGSFTIEGQPENAFQEENGVVVTNSNFFELFDIEWISGNKEVLSEPNTAVISRDVALKYFNSIDPNTVIGKTLKYNDQYSVNVAGLIENQPSNSDLPFTIFLSEATFKQEIDYEQWGRIEYSVQHFLLLAENTDVPALQAKLPVMVEKYTSERFAKRMVNSLQPLSTLHFDTKYGNFNARVVAKETMYSLGIIGLILLITACINFINLATANATKRSKEVGIRKVLGSDRNQLIAYFLGETSIITMVAIMISVLLAKLSYPYIVEIIGFSPSMNFLQDGQLTLFLLIVAVVVVVFSGIYPAIVSASFTPAQALKSNTNPKSGGTLLRKGLVIVQFAISQILIVCTFVVANQMDYFLNKDLGYNKEGIISIQLPQSANPDLASYNKIVDMLSAIPDIEAFTLANGAATSSNIWMHSYSFEGSAPDGHYIVQMKYGDDNYIKTFEMNMLAGRVYRKSDTLSEVVINEKMMNEMGVNEPDEVIGKFIGLGRGSSNQVKVVGVVNDFNLSSLHDPIQPAAIGSNVQNYYSANIRLTGDHVKDKIAKIEAGWNGIYPAENFEFQFLDEELAGFYEAEERISNLFVLFSGIAIFIGCLGLFGLISFMANQKTKEVGIRKVLGASIPQIMYLFSFDFLKLVLIAFVIAGPLSYYYMNEWLNEFTFRIDIGAGIFVSAILTSVVIALITMSYRSFQAASANPVNTLRSE